MLLVFLKEQRDLWSDAVAVVIVVSATIVGENPRFTWNQRSVAVDATSVTLATAAAVVAGKEQSYLEKLKAITDLITWKYIGHPFLI